MASDAAVDKMETPETEPEAAAPSIDDNNHPPAQAEATSSPSRIADLSPKMALQGKVAKVELAGALVEIGVERPGFLHISQLSSNKRVNNVTDVLNEGDEVTVYVLDVDKKKDRISLTLIEPPAFLWSELRGMVNQIVKGTVVRLEKFGAFVDIGAERPGLIHVSELSEEYVGSPESVVSQGQEVEAKIIGVDIQKKQVDLSIKALTASTIIEEEEDEEDENEALTAMAFALRKAMANADGSKKGRKKKGKGKGAQADILARTLATQKKN